jgi:YfiH family protein
MSKLIVPQWPLPKGVAACSSSRIGGVSLPPYDSLNLGAHCGDNPDHVEENRKRLFAAGNLPSKPVWLEQVHGKDVLKLTGEPYASKRADASYSNTPGTVCAVMTADCLPVLFCNRVGTEVAAAHAGWRGTCWRIAEKVVKRMQEEFGSHPQHINVVIGPSISGTVYNVGTELIDNFSSAGFPVAEIFNTNNELIYLDLWKANQWLLESMGVPADHIQISEICTYTQHEKFFSARRLGLKSGRMLSAIMLK